MARLLDGKQLAQAMQEEIAARAEAYFRKHGRRACLAAVLVGDNPASHVYVRNKRKACEKVGLDSRLHELPADTPEAELLALVGQLNCDPLVHGILVQLPLPPHIREMEVIRAVSPAKDVDGFGPESLGAWACWRPGSRGFSLARRRGSSKYWSGIRCRWKAATWSCWAGA
jgi:methylenetetrahydrofolate dehydrogenase (NADP+)/methenyltetrahydrofolate cyclohydrolase